MISGDVNIVDYEMAEFRDEIIDVATILYHRDLQDIMGEKITSPWDHFLLDNQLYSM